MGLQVIARASYFYFKRKVLSNFCWNAANSRLWDASPSGNGLFAFSPGVILGAGEGESAYADDGCASARTKTVRRLAKVSLTCIFIVSSNSNMCTLF